MIHHRQGLPLAFEPSDDLFRVHAQLDDLQRHPAADGLSLFGDVNDTAATLANLFRQLVAPERLADVFIGFLDGLDFAGLQHGYGNLYPLYTTRWLGKPRN